MVKQNNQNIPKFETHPIIKKLEEGTKDGSLVIFEGFIGVSDKMIRLYQQLDLNEYLEIPKECIMEIMPIPDDKENRKRLFVKGSCEVIEVKIIRNSVKAEGLEQPPKVAERQKLPDFMRKGKEFIKEIIRETNCQRAHHNYDNCWSRFMDSGSIDDFKLVVSAWDDVVKYCHPPVKV